GRSLTEGGAIHGPTLWIGLASIALVLVLRLIKRLLGWPLLPEFLITVVAMAAVTAALELDRQGVKVVGDIPTRLPRPARRAPLPPPPPLAFPWIKAVAPSPLAMALLGLLEAISMAKAIAAVTRQRL